MNVLQVRLPTNFKSARFESDQHTAILRQLEADIEAIRFGPDKLELPVKLKVHDSVFVPLAKWAMLMAGNYRCVTRDGMRPIKDAVHGDINATRDMYQWVVKLCTDLGADPGDLVPFEKYANAALSLQSPSSAARACMPARLTSSGSTSWCNWSRKARAAARRCSMNREARRCATGKEPGRAGEAGGRRPSRTERA